MWWVLCWMCSNQRNTWHHTWIKIQQQEVKAVKIVIPSFMQQKVTTVLLTYTRGIKIDINWSLLPSGRNWQPNTFSAAHRYLKYLIIKNIKKPSSTSLVTCYLNGHHIPNQKLSPLSFLSQRTANHSQPSSITIGTQLPVSRLSTIWPSKPLSAYTKSSSVHNYLIDSTKTYCLSQHNS